MVSSEDFSFPKINYSLPTFAISPSLWRVSSVVYPDYVDEREEEEGGEGDVSRGSFEFSCPENINEEKKKEKMDMLWEDFNEELHRAVSNNSSIKDQSKGRSCCHSHSREKMLVEICCAQKTSRTGSGMIYHEIKRSRSSILVVMKVLKNLFLLKNSPRIKKN